MLNVWIASGMAVMAAACGDDGGGSSPAAASATTSSVAVTLTSPIKLGDTAQASATATMSSGHSQPVSTGWRSDAQSVATVTDGGLVTGVANGSATIFVVSGGRQGQQVLRVVPDFQGQWSGGLRITACTESGEWTRIGFCKEFPVGSTDGFGLGLTQTGESLTVRPDYGSSFSLPQASASIAADGSASFGAVFTGKDTPVTIDSTWRISSPSRGALAGTVSEVWKVGGVAGEARLEQDIVQTTRSGTTVTSSAAARVRAAGRVRVLR
jgi:hypothetical protein